MCGLSVVVGPGPDEGLAAALLAMHARIPHRGPDGEGFCLLDAVFGAHGAADRAGLESLAAGVGARAALAFRWLQIQDRSPASAQPMASDDGAVRLVFNGEIYNFRALRVELEARGHRFRTASDTEVILAAYRAWGTGMFERLDGMWALALLDLPARRLITSRDRFGIKPLYYARHEGRLLFASEAKQLLAAGVPAHANVEAAGRFIRGARPASTEQTFFASIAAHPAAAYCEIDLRQPPGRLDFVPYWKLPARGAQSITFDQACQRLDEILGRTVEEHMAAAVPVGVLASGGLDSSIVAALSVRGFSAREQKPAAFSMVLPPGETLDESAWIRRLTAALGFEAHSALMDPRVLRERLPGLAQAQEEPVAGIAVAGQYLALELAASRGVRVVLDGQGADEMFAGYPRHQFAYLSEGARRGAWASVLAEACAILWREPAFFRTTLAGRLRTRSRPPGAAFLRSEPAVEGGRGALDETLRHDVVAGNLRWVLAVTDRNAMAHSIEARVPYVSRAVAEFAFSLPDRFKVGAGRRKRILRAVGERHLPAAFVRRANRVGFGVPGGRWLREAFAADLRGLAQGPAYASGALADPGSVRRYVEGFLHGEHDDAGTAWRLYAVDRWARAYSVAGL